MQATVETSKGTFTAIGDASPANVNRRIAPHAIRMAETRSIGRALRLAVDVGVVTVEELNGDGEDIVPVESPPAVRQALPRPPPVRARAPGRDNAPELAARTDTRAMSPEQRRFLFRLAFALGETRESALARVQTAVGVDDLESATRAQVARAIDALKAELADHEAERNAIQQMNGAGQSIHP